MATIIVEDGSIVSGANSYISEADLATYAADRGITIEGIPADIIIQGMDYIESLNYKGVKSTSTQGLQWPRFNVEVDGYLIASDIIPQLLIEGLAETVLAVDAGNSPLGDVERKQQQVVVGNVSVTYANSSASSTIVTKISSKLNKLLESGLGGVSYKVTRG